MRSTSIPTYVTEGSFSKSWRAMRALPHPSSMMDWLRHGTKAMNTSSSSWISGSLMLLLLCSGRCASHHIPCLEGLCGVHQGRTAAHIHRHREHLFQLGTRAAQLVKCLDVKANAPGAMLADANGQCNQLFVLGTDGAFCHGRLCQLREPLHGLALRLAERRQAGIDVLHQSGVIKSAHG